MEIIAIFRILARHRLAVTLGVVLALAAGAAAVMHGGTSQTSARAWGSVLFAEQGMTPSLHESGASDTLPERATLLADLMTTQSARAVIAQAAHLPLADVAVRGPAMGTIQVPVPFAVAAESAGIPSARYTVAVNTQHALDVSPLPIIAITVAGPDLATAERVEAGVTKAMALLTSAPADTGKGIPPLVAQSLGAPQGAIVSAGGRKIIGAVAAVMLVILWCSAIVIGSGLRRRDRARRVDARAMVVPESA